MSRSHWSVLVSTTHCLLHLGHCKSAKNEWSKRPYQCFMFKMFHEPATIFQKWKKGKSLHNHNWLQIMQPCHLTWHRAGLMTYVSTNAKAVTYHKCKFTYFPTYVTVTDTTMRLLFKKHRKINVKFKTNLHWYLFL